MRHGSARAKSAEAPSTPAYYEWRPQGRPISIQVSFSVIDQLEADVMKGFWSVPKRGAEVGGVLFGRANVTDEFTSLVIDGYEPVECEYRRGPSFVLSETDRRRLERTLRKGSPDRQVVGFYRSHTRVGLYLDQDDYSLVQSYFPGPSQVCLLVRPHASKTSVGGFFFWEEGTIRRQATYLEFPFSRAEILKRTESSERPEEPEWATIEAPPAAAAIPAAAAQVRAAIPAAAAQVRAAVPPIADLLRAFGRAAAPVIAQVRKTNWRPLGIAALVLLSLGLVEYQFLKLFARRVPIIMEADYSPALQIVRNGKYLHVNWNRKAPSIMNAERGVLRITDGSYSRELQLDAGQLRTGSIAYSPAGDDVSFRLDVVGPRTTVSESLRVVEAVASPAALPTAAPAKIAEVRPASAKPRPIVRSAPPPPPVKQRASRIQKHAWFDDGL
jgi:hypothetical protein